MEFYAEFANLPSYTVGDLERRLLMKQHRHRPEVIGKEGAEKWVNDVVYRHMPTTSHNPNKCTITNATPSTCVACSSLNTSLVASELPKPWNEKARLKYNKLKEHSMGRLKQQQHSSSTLTDPNAHPHSKLPRTDSISPPAFNLGPSQLEASQAQKPHQTPPSLTPWQSLASLRQPRDLPRRSSFMQYQMVRCVTEGLNQLPRFRQRESLVNRISKRMTVAVVGSSNDAEEDADPQGFLNRSIATMGAITNTEKMDTTLETFPTEMGQKTMLDNTNQGLSPDYSLSLPLTTPNAYTQDPSLEVTERLSGVIFQSKFKHLIDSIDNIQNYLKVQADKCRQDLPISNPGLLANPPSMLVEKLIKKLNQKVEKSEKVRQSLNQSQPSNENKPRVTKGARRGSRKSISRDSSNPFLLPLNPLASSNTTNKKSNFRPGATTTPPLSIPRLPSMLHTDHQELRLLNFLNKKLSVMRQYEIQIASSNFKVERSTRRHRNILRCFNFIEELAQGTEEELNVLLREAEASLAVDESVFGGLHVQEATLKQQKQDADIEQATRDLTKKVLARRKRKRKVKQEAELQQLTQDSDVPSILEQQRSKQMSRSKNNSTGSRQHPWSIILEHHKNGDGNPAIFKQILDEINQSTFDLRFTDNVKFVDVAHGQGPRRFGKLVQPVNEPQLCRFLARQYCKQAARGFRCSVIVSEVHRSMGKRYSLKPRIDDQLKQTGLSYTGILEDIQLPRNFSADKSEEPVKQLICRQRQHRTKLKRLLRSIKKNSPDKYDLLYMKTEQGDTDQNNLL